LSETPQWSFRPRKCRRLRALQQPTRNLAISSLVEPCRTRHGGAQSAVASPAIRFAAASVTADRVRKSIFGGKGGLLPSLPPMSRGPPGGNCRSPPYLSSGRDDTVRTSRAALQKDSQESGRDRPARCPSTARLGKCRGEKNKNRRRGPRNEDTFRCRMVLVSGAASTSSNKTTPLRTCWHEEPVR